MRKYTATITQMLNLDKNQMDWVYQHLGNTKGVHKEHHRQMSGLLERTQVSKMFLIQDLNLTSKFKGKKLEEMDLKDIVFAEDDNAVENLPEQLSIPEDEIAGDEALLLVEAGSLDTEDEDDEEEVKSTKKSSTRQKWVEEEVSELQKYFMEFLETGSTPRCAFIHKMKKKSKKNCGRIHLRANHLIIKKYQT